MKPILKTTLVILGSIALVGCSIHSRHHYGHHGYRSHHHTGVHISGHAHGRGVAGALVAGAVIGYVINEASRSHREEHHRKDYSSNNEPDTNYYLKTLEGKCFWVQKDHNNVKRQTEVDEKYCVED